MVTMRSVSGMKLERMLSRVVLPEPVPPVTTMLRRSRTATIRNSSIGWLSEPKVSRSFLQLALGELSDADARATQRHRRMMALTREPSFSRASTIGELSSMRRPRASRCARWLTAPRGHW
jgi:hypothetical protein